MYPAKVWITPVFLKKTSNGWSDDSVLFIANQWFFHVFSATGKQTIASTEGLGWRGEASENGPEILEFPPACVGNLWKTMGSGDSSRDLLITYCSWRLPTTFERSLRDPKKAQRIARILIICIYTTYIYIYIYIYIHQKWCEISSYQK